MGSTVTLRAGVKHQWRIEENPFPNLYVNLTNRCNMSCNYCYNPAPHGRDMDLKYFTEACRRLPAPVSWRFLGGEPALHPDFFGFVDAAYSHGHLVHFSSNGMKFLDHDFMVRLASYGRKLSLACSMDGGTAGREIYRFVNNRDCLEDKLRAMENLRLYGIERVTLCAIIIRGVNERVVGELYELAGEYRDIVHWIHFRNAARLGRWIDTKPYDLDGLKNLAWKVFSAAEFRPCCRGEINCNNGDGTCCYRFRPNRLLQVSLIEFATERAAACPYRGKLMDGTFAIESLFGNMIREGIEFNKTVGEISLDAAQARGS